MRLVSKRNRDEFGNFQPKRHKEERDFNFKLQHQYLKMKEIKIQTKNLGTIILRQISKEIAREMIVKNHYSHTWNEGGFGRFNFGIFKENSEECLGVAVYGYMKNPQAKIFKHPNKKAWICELNRLWISDVLGKNAESLFIAHTIKWLKRLDPNIVAVQSFADGRLGCGTIYKASNFKYFGKHHTIFLRNKISDKVLHQQLLTNSTSKKAFIRHNIAYLLGDMEVFKVNTYRYIFPLCKHFEFIKRQEPYPAYNKGTIPFEWQRNRKHIKEKLIKLISELE